MTDPFTENHLTVGARIEDKAVADALRLMSVRGDDDDRED